MVQDRKGTSPAANAARCVVCNAAIDQAAEAPCAECGHSPTDALAVPSRPRFFSLPAMRYQNAYVWLVFAATMDAILTRLVLKVWMGSEVNPIAAAVINVMGYNWAIVFKLATILLVIVICEVVGRRDDKAGRQLAYLAVFINAVPVAYTFFLLGTSDPAVPTPIV